MTECVGFKGRLVISAHLEESSEKCGHHKTLVLKFDDGMETRITAKDNVLRFVSLQSFQTKGGESVAEEERRPEGQEGLPEAGKTHEARKSQEDDAEVPEKDGVVNPA